KLDHLRVAERPAGEYRAQLAAESVMNLLEQYSAQPQLRLLLGQRAIDLDHPVEYESLERRQFVEALLQTRLQVFQNQRGQRDIGDLVARERFAHEFRTQRPQVHHGSAANERADESDHEVYRVVRWQDAQVSHTRPERV